jgi:hypothetical protein
MLLDFVAYSDVLKRYRKILMESRVCKMHVNDPMRRYYWFFFICEGIVFGMILLQAIVSTLAGRPNYFFYGEAIFFLLLLIFVFFSFKRRHQRTEVRRQHALLGDPAFRVQPQPIPDANALEMPTTIHLRLSKKYLLEFMGIFYIFIDLILVGIFVVALPATKNVGYTLIIIGIILVAMFLTFLFAFLLSLIITGPFVEQEIAIDEQGITTKFFRQHTHIAWNEVQSFAMWGNAKRFAVIQFELTSERGVARWFQLGPRRTFLTWFTMLKPDLSLDEYREKMTRLQQVIVARTGKPLYDLRDEKIVWW